ncbi:MAG: hypothetical protein Q7S27_05870 [Nanoarchaeota archaeon]|nr:hypothetical protein [Nanoarchaeota archaeon]
MKEDEKRLKMAIISGAAHALKFKTENPRASEQEIIQQVALQANEILLKIDAEV